MTDEGAPSFNPGVAASLASLAIPAFACTPHEFPDLMAAAIGRQNLHPWAAENEIVLARRREGE